MRKRKKDTCLNVGVGIDIQASANFYIMSSETLSTFSNEEAERYKKYENQNIEEIIQVPLIPIDEIIKNNFPHCPNFISLDVEGLDLEIMRNFNFNNYRPEVFCMENTGNFKYHD
jgi:FkbM family methyltransferase